MPQYTWKCNDCGHTWIVIKRMSEDGPSKCLKCKKRDVERDYSDCASIAVTYANRPPWTYKEALKYKDCRVDDGPRLKIDPNKHGDIGAWHCPGEVVPFNKADKAKARRQRRQRQGR